MKDSNKNDVKKPASDTKRRRKFLAALTTVSTAGVVTHWKKPVVNSVVLPSHASNTGVVMGNLGGSGTLVSGL